MFNLVILCLAVIRTFFQITVLLKVIMPLNNRELQTFFSFAKFPKLGITKNVNGQGKKLLLNSAHMWLKLKQQPILIFKICNFTTHF